MKTSNTYYLFYNSGCDAGWEIYGPLFAEAVLNQCSKWEKDGIVLRFYDTFPNVHGPECEEARIVIINGDTVVPKAVEVVKKRTLP
jgi:hypothetical protein